MSGRVITKFILTCDACDVDLGEFESATEARAAAYVEGWRFPNKLNKKGAEMRRTHDVCVDCRETFEVPVGGES